MGVREWKGLIRTTGDFESHSLINERNCNNLVFSAFSPCLESLQLHMRSCSSCLILSTAVLTRKKILTTAIHFKQKGGESKGRCQLEMLFEQQVFRTRIERSVKQISLRINVKILASNTSNITHEKKWNDDDDSVGDFIIFLCVFQFFYTFFGSFNRQRAKFSFLTDNYSI